jgi:hypothetical protein
MELRDLVRALLTFDTLAARQWLADAGRSGLVWAERRPYLRWADFFTRSHQR